MRPSGQGSSSLSLAVDAGLDHHSGYWERRTPVRRGLSAERNAAVACEAAPHWGAALPSPERTYARALVRCGLARVMIGEDTASPAPWANLVWPLTL